MRRYSFSPTPSRSPHYNLLSLKYSPVIYPAGETLRRNPWAYMPCSNILLFALCCNPVTQHGVSDCAATTRTLIESQCPQVFARKTAGGTRQKSGNFRLWSRVCRRDNKKDKGEKRKWLSRLEFGRESVSTCAATPVFTMLGRSGTVDRPQAFVLGTFQ